MTRKELIMGESVRRYTNETQLPSPATIQDPGKGNAHAERFSCLYAGRTFFPVPVSGPNRNTIYDRLWAGPKTDVASSE